MTTQVKKIKPEKITEVGELEKLLAGRNLVFVGYERVNVGELNNVRGALRKDGGSLRISKNTLLRRALKNKSIETPDTLLTGMTAVAVVGQDFALAGRALADSEKADKLKIKGGYHDGKLVDAAYVKKLANIPPRNVLYSMLVGAIQGPIADLVYTLQAIHDKRKAEGDKPAA